MKKNDVNKDSTQESIHTGDPVSVGCKRNVETVKMSGQTISSDSRFQSIPGEGPALKEKTFRNHEHIKYDETSITSNSGKP